mgnify:CR=1 FL=1
MTEVTIFETLEKFADDGKTINAPIEQVADAVFELLRNRVGKVMFENGNVPLQQVQQFHEIFGHPIAEEPQLIPLKRLAFRLRVMLEEMAELSVHAYDDEGIAVFKNCLKESLETVDDIPVKGYISEAYRTSEALDALVDLQYFLNGAILEFGMHKVFNAAFYEVHNSNLSKLAKDTDTIVASVDDYAFKGVEARAEFREHPVIGKYAVILRNSDDKILKAVSWKEADLRRFIPGTFLASENEAKNP